MPKALFNVRPTLKVFSPTSHASIIATLTVKYSEVITKLNQTPPSFDQWPSRFATFIFIHNTSTYLFPHPILTQLHLLLAYPHLPPRPTTQNHNNHPSRPLPRMGDRLKPRLSILMRGHKLWLNFAWIEVADCDLPDWYTCARSWGRQSHYVLLLFICMSNSHCRDKYWCQQSMRLSVLW